MTRPDRIRLLFRSILAGALLVGCAPALDSVRLAEQRPDPTATLASAATAATSVTSALTGSEWVLVSLQGQSLLPGVPITLCFERDRFTSFTGCNTLTGKYVVADPGALGFPELALTTELCPEPEGIMEQEEAYVDAFLSVATYRFSRDTLELQNAAGGTVLVYALQAGSMAAPRPDSQTGFRQPGRYRVTTHPGRWLAQEQPAVRPIL